MDQRGPKSDWHGWLNTTASLVTIAAVVWYGGSLWSTVKAHESRLGAIEIRGTASLQRHEAVDDERIDSLRARLRNIEQIVVAVGDMRADLRVIQAKIDKLQEDLKSHVATNRP
jgi:hypothetical protein